MRPLAFALLLGMLPLAAQHAGPARAELVGMEESLDQRIRRYNVAAPMELLGFTRGLYLEGYGAVFTAEVNLVVTPGISPFRPTIRKEEIVTIREAKLKRLPDIRNIMRDMMVASASSLDSVSKDEQIVVGMLLFYNSWEDVAGLPRRIIMRGKRGPLLDVATARQPKTALDSIIQVREE